jgi:hypothetical protein
MRGRLEPPREAFLRLSAMLYAPSAATVGLGAREVFSAAIVVFLGYLLLSVAALPLGLKALGAGEAAIRPSPTSIAALVALQATITTALLCLRWLFVAYVVWAFASAWGKPASFVAGLGVVVLAETPRLLENAFILTLIVLRRSPVQSTLDLRPPIGVNLYLDGLSLRMDALLNQLNVFELWHVAVLALGIRSVFHTSTGAALLLASGLWLMGLVIQVAFGAH